MSWQATQYGRGFEPKSRDLGSNLSGILHTDFQEFTFSDCLKSSSPGPSSDIDRVPCGSFRHPNCCSDYTLGGSIRLTPSDPLSFGCHSIRYVEDGFAAKLQDRIRGDRLLNLGQIVGVTITVIVYITEATIQTGR